MRLEFDTPVPLNEGCVIEILFPGEFQLSGADLSLVEGMNLFEAKRPLTGVLDSPRNSYTIKDGCKSY